MDNRPIGVFDSGLGGLTVVKQLAKALPNESIVYFGDTGRVPYGTKSTETIYRYAKQDIHFLQTQQVKMIIAACGTVSSVAPHAADDCGVPFVGVVESAAQEAARVTKNKKIGILGTAATVESCSYKKAIELIDPDISVVQNACTLFVPFVEAGWFSADDPVVREMVRRYLQPIIDFGCDTVVLGCTHYPVLSQVIGEVVGEEVKLINTGKTTAKQVKQYFAEHDLFASGPVENHFYVSDTPSSFRKTAEILLNSQMEFDVQRIDIERF